MLAHSELCVAGSLRLVDEWEIAVIAPGVPLDEGRGKAMTKMLRVSLLILLTDVFAHNRGR